MIRDTTNRIWDPDLNPGDGSPSCESTASGSHLSGAVRECGHGEEDSSHKTNDVRRSNEGIGNDSTVDDPPEAIDRGHGVWERVDVLWDG